MITEYMMLTSRVDARTWADYYDLHANGTDRLTDWIWKHKPHPACYFSEHPLSTLSDEEFWAIVEA